jgi:hypothetical protein
MKEAEKATAAKPVALTKKPSVAVVLNRTVL